MCKGIVVSAGSCIVLKNSKSGRFAGRELDIAIFTLDCLGW